MKAATTTIHEIQTNFRSVEVKLEQHGRVIVTDKGTARYEIRPLNIAPKTHRTTMPDYYARALKRQPKAMTVAEADNSWAAERGGQQTSPGRPVR